ncbi:dihydroxyacetone kinase [Arthrobacter stackebrandtii]|uniref:Dihydroxyacetone kinase n=1 Tax=Arthrobacter stackebrandtii TaxID=272161 RepID=A0ABS4YU47_9MICC|nr:dihydroxyacetone kinase [Arthrobacter stackebrandtii]
MTDHSRRNDRLIQQIAYLYHIQGQTQAQIAASVNVSRATVSRLLSEARLRGVVQIRIGPPVDRLPKLEQELKRQFGLAVCVISMDRPQSLQEKANQLGYVAARYLEATLSGGVQLGVAASRTLAAVASALEPGAESQLTVVDLLACPPRVNTDSDERNHVAENIARRLGAAFSPLPANFVYREATVRDKALEMPEVQAGLERARASDVALLGLGSMQRFDGTGSYSPVSPVALAELEGRGAVGHLCGHFFDSRGEEVESELASRIIGIALPELLEIPRRVMVVSGSPKVGSLAAAIKGGFVNELVTDESTARELLAALSR